MGRFGTTSSIAGLPSAPEREIIFSLRDGFIWASWPGTNAATRLGRQEMVSAMMRDFLAQDAVGERLSLMNGQIGAPPS
jgi:hypothetical protein